MHLPPYFSLNFWSICTLFCFLVDIWALISRSTKLVDYSFLDLQMKNLESELERRTVTYTVWNQSTSKTDNGAWHPFTFSYADSGPQQIKRIRVCFRYYIHDLFSFSFSLLSLLQFGYLVISLTKCVFSGYQPCIL